MVTEGDRPAARLSIALFGPLEVRLCGRPLPPLRSRKAQALLTLLVLKHGAEVRRSWLSATLWPDAPESQASFYVRRALTELRHWLGPEAHRILSPTPRTVCLDLQGVEADVIAFDQAIAHGDRGDPRSGHPDAVSAPRGHLTLAQAVALYRGPLLTDCQEEWLLPERAAREEAYLQALETLAAREMAHGEHAAAVGHLRRAVAVDPLRESAQRALLEALAKSGEHAAAVLTYREFRLLLHRELNAEPDPETTALFRQLRTEAHDRARVLSPPPAPTPATPAPRHLPHPPSSFVGREHELREIGACLGTSRLVTLTGTGGIGKTRLAIRVAEELADDYPDGVWFVDLAPLTDPALVPQAVARVLGVHEERGSPLTATLQAYLRSKELLLVLDNCEHLIDASAHLAEALLGDCGRLRVLATSRQALGLSGETAWPVPSLFLPPSPQHWQEQRTPVGENLISILLKFGAVRLLVERGRAVAPGFTVTERNWEATVAVCRQLEGIPLAIELAAARLKAMTVEQLSVRLEDRTRLLTWGSRTAVARQQTLRATLDWSYELLTEGERALLRRLSVFAGGWTLEAAEAVCTDEDERRTTNDERRPAGGEPVVGRDDVLDLLEQLVDKSLVVLEAGEAPGRYRLLETIRQYGQEHLRAGAGAEDRGRGEGARRGSEEVFLRRRHRDWFLGLAERAEPELQGPRQSEWMERLEREHDNLRAALDWSLEAGASPDRMEQSGETRPDAEAGVRMAAALSWFWLVRGYLTEGRMRLAALLGLDGATERTRVRARALKGAGVLAWFQGDYPPARALLEESLAISRALNEKRGIADALNNLGTMAKEQGDYETARAFLEESLALRRELGDKLGLAASLNNLAMLVSEQSDYVAARSLHEQSLALRRELGDKWGLASSLNNLGAVAQDQGDYLAARAFYEESLALKRELGDKCGLAVSLTNLGLIAQEQGEYAVAQGLCEESLVVLRELGDKRGLAASLQILGLAAQGQGDSGAARARYEESLAIRREIGDKRGIAECLEGLAGLAGAQGENGEATNWVTSARLFGAAEALRHSLGAPPPPRQREEIERSVATVRAALGEQEYAAAWTAGQAMTLEQAVCTALGED